VSWSSVDVIVSHLHRCIFVHCRKTAGTAIKAALGCSLGPRDVVIGGLHEILERGGRLNRASLCALLHPKAWPAWAPLVLGRASLREAMNFGVKRRYRGLLSRNPAHPSAKQIREAFPREWDQYYKFCFVRNPFEQVLSDYFGRRTHTGYTGSFRDFLAALEAAPDTSPLFPEGHIPNYLMYTIDGRVAVDFIGRYEHLERDFEAVTRAVGLEARKIERVNTGSYDGGPKQYYGPSEIRIVSRLYAREIELFGYSLDMV
jgi:hypothetical protein